MTAKYYFYDNYFDLPGALLCGRVVDMLHKVIFDECVFIVEDEFFVYNHIKMLMSISLNSVEMR